MRHTLSQGRTPRRRLVPLVSALALLVPGVVIVIPVTSSYAGELSSSQRVELVDEGKAFGRGIVEMDGRVFVKSEGGFTSGGSKGSPDDYLLFTIVDGRYCDPSDVNRTYKLRVGTDRKHTELVSTECKRGDEEHADRSATEYFWFPDSELKSPNSSGLGN